MKVTGNVILTAEEYNWSCSLPTDWQKTLFILGNDGELTIVIYEGKAITEKRITISDTDLSFIRSHISDYLNSTENIGACDGTAWRIQCGLQTFETGHVCGTGLEKITDILNNAERQVKEFY